MRSSGQNSGIFFDPKWKKRDKLLIIGLIIIGIIISIMLMILAFRATQNLHATISDSVSSIAYMITGYAISSENGLMLLINYDRTKANAAFCFSI